MSFPKVVVDETGTIHRLAPSPLGKGGQGVVFRTRNPDIAVKLITTETVRGDADGMTPSKRLQSILAATDFQPRQDAEAHQQIRQRLDDVLLLPLEDLQIARPIAPLKEHAGYAMRLLVGMGPVSALIAPAGTIDLARFYLNTGGLRRRLLVLAATARVMARIHAIPAVYGDLSPNNVFISEDRDHHEAWLIDPDNLRLDGQRGPTVYTPGFGAPEVLQGKSRSTTLSDAWSFAVLAFWVLCQSHPMLGELVEEGGWEESVDLEQKAFAGELPWLHDENDDQNYGEYGIYPRELALSTQLEALFQRALGAGRLNPAKRPGLSEWAEVLQQAADLTLRCTECGSTSYISARGCAWCDTKKISSFLYIQVKRWHPEVDEDTTPNGSSVGHLVVDGDRKEFHLPRRLVRATLPRDRDEDCLRLKRTRGGYQLSPITGGPYLLIETETGKVTDVNTTVSMSMPVAGRECHLHCGPIDKYHRVASLRFFPESER